MSTYFSRGRIIGLLEELERRLALKGISAELYIVGGAAMALAFDRGRVTRDIDAVFVPKSEVMSVVQSMAEDFDDVDQGWLNDAVKGFLTPVADVDASGIEIGPHLSVLVASPQRLLAMKIFAARIDRDSDDILTLCKHLKIESIEQVLDVAHSQYGALLKPVSKFLTIELLQEHLPYSVRTIQQTPVLTQPHIQERPSGPSLGM